MDCKYCKNKVVLHAFSDGECEICNTHIDSPYIPCNRVCEGCSDKKGLCETCGDHVFEEIGKTWFLEAYIGTPECYSMSVVGVYGSSEAAEKGEYDLFRRIRGIKEMYEREYGTNYDEDVEYLKSAPSVEKNNEKHNIVESQVLTYKKRHMGLRVFEIKIKESVIYG